MNVARLLAHSRGIGTHAKTNSAAPSSYLFVLDNPEGLEDDPLEYHSFGILGQTLSRGAGSQRRQTSFTTCYAGDITAFGFCGAKVWCIGGATFAAVQCSGWIAVLPKSPNPERKRQNIDIFGFEIDDLNINTIKSMDRGDGVTWANGDPSKLGRGARRASLSKLRCPSVAVEHIQKRLAKCDVHVVHRDRQP